MLIDADMEYAISKGSRMSNNAWRDRIQGRQNDYGKWPKTTYLEDKYWRKKVDDPKQIVPGATTILKKNVDDLRKRLGGGQSSSNKRKGLPCTIDALNVVLQKLEPISDKEPYLKIGDISTQMRPPTRDTPLEQIEITLDLIFFTGDRNNHRIQMSAFLESIRETGAIVGDGALEQKVLEEGTGDNKRPVAISSRVKITLRRRSASGRAGVRHSHEEHCSRTWTPSRSSSCSRSRP